LKYGLTRDELHGIYLVWVCCEPVYDLDSQTWTHAAGCAMCEEEIIVRAPLVAYLGGPLKGGPRSKRRIV